MQLLDAAVIVTHLSKESYNTSTVLLFQKICSQGTHNMSSEIAKSDTTDWITLNVGGKRFLTCRSAFTIQIIPIACID